MGEPTRKQTKIDRRKREGGGGGQVRQFGPSSGTSEGKCRKQGNKCENGGKHRAIEIRVLWDGKEMSEKEDEREGDTQVLNEHETTD